MFTGTNTKVDHDRYSKKCCLSGKGPEDCIMVTHAACPICQLRDARARIKELEVVLGFYANPSHWMALSDAVDAPLTLLIAQGPHFKEGNGFEEAEQALRGGEERR